MRLNQTENTSVNPRVPTQRQDSAKKMTGEAFDATFRNAISDERSLKLSLHAQQRLVSRNIQVTPDDWSRMEQAVDQASAMGAKESLLVVMKDQAFIVNVPSRTIVTAVDLDGLKAKVFVHIDSTVMV
jgi:flagellar operon protein